MAASLFPSPLRYDGYDIANYVDVNPCYGTLQDFKPFLDAAHQRNMQVMIELVINHTSDQHPWFQAASAPGLPARDMLRLSIRPAVEDARIIFTDTEKSNWAWDETPSLLLASFFSHQPDLTFDNPRGNRRGSQGYALLAGHGCRCAAHGCHPVSGRAGRHLLRKSPETHAVIKTIRTAIDAEYANRLILAEANSGRPMSVPTSAMATSATWPFTSP